MNDRFTPIRGTEAQILASEPTKGYVWFALDTKKIYYSDGETFISMGGNSSIYYANMILAEEPDEGQIIFEFGFEDIDNNEDNSNIPNVDDLILNIPDGCFYRVVQISTTDEILLAQKLTIAGSGGGGDSEPTAKGSYTYRIIGSNDIAVLYKDPCSISFEYTAVDAQGDNTGKTKAVLQVNNVIKSEFTVMQGTNTFDISEHLGLGTNHIVLTTTIDDGRGYTFTKSKTWDVTTVSVELAWDYNETILNYTNQNFTLYWSVTGNVPKTTHIIIDELQTITSETTNRIDTQDFTILSSQLNNYGLKHGAHQIEMYVTAEIGGNIIRTPSIYKVAMFVEEGNNTPIVACNFVETNITQFNTVQIPIIVYNPEATSQGSVVTLREDVMLRDTWTNVQNCEVNYWYYTPTTSGERILTILCNNEEKRLILNVTELEIDNKEVGGYAFKFKATDFSSNNAVQNWESNGVTLNISDNFDWINGGIKTEIDNNGEARQYFCIKAGTSITINYKLFRQNIGSIGKTIKVIFKATRCRDYDAQVLKCYDDTTNIGLILRAQNAIYRSEQTNIDTQYCEDSYLEFETDIWGNPVNSTIINGMDVTPRYIMTWLDGVPSGAAVYATNDSFVNDEYITIGSDDCDVYLYMIKAYERHLKDAEHLANFIADAANSAEMIKRFRRNDILDDRGQISYTKLAEANPNCLVHLYECDHVSTHKKKDVVNGCNYIQYHGSDEAVMTAQNVTMKVQGTSSARYGVAAFNLDTKFNDGFDLADGTHIKKWAMTEDAIPVNYFTNKVNVASCEQANNALNQEYYNRFQPYICRYRRKNPKARDTMQFTPGVMFILDHNQTVDSTERDKNNVFKDTLGYVNEPYFKLYSICNMGNSKKNTEVFHDEENPYECCVEITDNQTRGQWMTEVPAYIQEQGKDDPTYIGELTSGNVVFTGSEAEGTLEATLEGLTAEEYAQWDLALSDAAFAFRYPEDVGTESHKAAFFRFVRWMSLNDPSAKYERIEVKDAEDFARKLEGYYADPVNQKDWIDPVILYTESPAAVGVTHAVAEVYDSSETYYVVASHPHGYTNEELPEPVTFGSYTFKDTEFTQKLKGLTISTYAGTYNTDCYEYRMAKMLSECEDYLIMDAVVFHYLFIERHTMIDNVAKNTFWSTEDLKHWGPLKDYDNDTADGNDNQGKLSLGYGYEALDPIDDKFVFNAHQAVWLNFINGIQPACSTMYTALNSMNTTWGCNAWDPEPYLKLFEDWQDCIPERVWIECYYRLYLRPREVYGAAEYIDMLTGGKKTHQRRQYETYQNYYIASKYTVSSETVLIRGNGTNLLNYTIPVKVYSDCYIKTEWGQQHFNKRVKRGEINNIICPIDNVNNATVYFYFPALYQSIGDLSGLLPEQFDSSAAIRLRELTLGGQTTNNTLKGANFAGNTQLEKLIVKNCPQVTMPLELSGAIALKELDITNSGFTGVTIADGAPLEKFYVEAPSSLVLTNLKYINDFRINSYNNLSTLYLNNIDESSAINSKELVDNSPNLSFYCLRNVDWQIDDSTELNISDKTINILERLETLRGKDTFGNILPMAESLAGQLEITGNAFNDSDSFDYYDKYAQRTVYPDLNINFTGNTAKLHTVKIYDGNDDIYWTRKITEGLTVNDSFLSEGPKGAYDTTKIIKSDTVTTTFEFANAWDIYDEEGNVLTGEEGYSGEIPYYENVVSDLIFKPRFIPHIRTYEVKFYNGENLINQGIYEHGTILRDVLPTSVPYRSDADLAFDMTNAFIGYGLSESSPTTINEMMQIRDNLTLYAMFNQKSVYDNVLPEHYLAFESLNNGNAYLVKAKPGIHFSGKITLPITHPQNGKDIVGIATNGFIGQDSITHVFWERKAGKTNKVNRLGQGMFQNDMNLCYFEMPELVTTIPESAFFNCNRLFHGSSQEQVDLFFKNIEEIENTGFIMAGTNGLTRLTTTCNLSHKLTTLGQAAMGSTGFPSFVIGSPGNPSQLDYNSCGTALFSNTYVTTQSFTIYADDATAEVWTNFRDKFSIDVNVYSVLDA